MWTNEQIHNVIMHLKDDGISYKYLASISGISYDSFYYYKEKRRYPVDIRLKIENAIKSMFGDEINEYCK